MNSGLPVEYVDIRERRPFELGLRVYPKRRSMFQFYQNIFSALIYSGFRKQITPQTLTLSVEI
jgi:hypothetical protein